MDAGSNFIRVQVYQINLISPLKVLAFNSGASSAEQFWRLNFYSEKAAVGDRTSDAGVTQKLKFFSMLTGWGGGGGVGGSRRKDLGSPRQTRDLQVQDYACHLISNQIITLFITQRSWHRRPDWSSRDPAVTWDIWCASGLYVAAQLPWWQPPNAHG